MSHNLAKIPESPLDQSCADCGACRRDDGTWYAQGYRPKRTPPPCSPLLRHIEEWAGIPERQQSPLRTLTTPRKVSEGPAPFRAQDYVRPGAHALRKKW